MFCMLQRYSSFSSKGQFDGFLCETFAHSDKKGGLSADGVIVVMVCELFDKCTLPFAHLSREPGWKAFHFTVGPSTSLLVHILKAQYIEKHIQYTDPPYSFCSLSSSPLSSLILVKHFLFFSILKGGGDVNSYRVSFLQSEPICPLGGDGYRATGKCSS